MGQLPALESIKITNKYCEDERNRTEMIRYISEHKGLKSIKFGEEEVEVLINDIIPFLSSGGFDTLQKLSLTFNFQDRDDFHLLDGALKDLGTIQSLEELKLKIDWEWDEDSRPWEPWHFRVRTALGPLKRLRVLKLCGDSAVHLLGEPYSSWGMAMRISAQDGKMRGHPRDMSLLRARPDLDGAYLNSDDSREVWKDDENTGNDTQGDNDDDTDEGDEDADDEESWIGPVADPYCALNVDQRFELLLRNAHLKKADAYAAKLPKLERLIIGGLPIEIKNPRCGRHGNAVPTQDAVSTWMSSVIKANSGVSDEDEASEDALSDEEMDEWGLDDEESPWADEEEGDEYEELSDEEHEGSGNDEASDDESNDEEPSIEGASDDE